MSSQHFCDIIRDYRNESGLTKKELSDALGVSASYIALLENGKRSPSQQIAKKIAQYFFPDSIEQQDKIIVAAGYVPQNYRPFIKEKSVIELYKKALEESPRDFQVHLNLVLVLIRSGMHQEAKIYIDKGIATFDNLSQLQSLLATYELSQKHFETAIEYQSSAIKYFQLEEEKKDEDLAELLLSLGVMYFMKGFEHIDRSIEAETQKNRVQVDTENNNAHYCLDTALETFENALVLKPGDIYVLDEIARVQFNLAYINPSQKSLWTKAIDAFREVICSPYKETLGRKNLKETNIYLAHAYSKSHQWDEANFLLGVLESASPDYWMVHYARACYYSLKSEVQKTDENLQKALNSLKKGLQCPQGYQIKIEAVLDPDLAYLRSHQESAFFAVIKASYYSVKD